METINSNIEKAKRRKQAEALLKKNPSNRSEQLSAADTLRLLHELDVHQIELELQNEELILARDDAQKATEKYTELYDFAPSGYLSLSDNCEIQELNFSAAKMLGKERSNLINKSLYSFIHESSKFSFQQFFEKVLSTNNNKVCEVILSNNHGTTTDVYLTGINTSDKGKCFIGMVDISNIKSIERELILSKEKAEESDRLKSAFLANMSHEIRTPMNGILGFTDLLKKLDLTGKERKKYIEVIERGGERLLNTINDIIDISRIESGEVTTNINPSDINLQLNGLYEFFKPEADKKNIELTFKPGLDSSLATIQTDAGKIDSIFTNLIKNALKYTQKGAIEFGYTLEDNKIHFYIKDTGLGIKLDKLKSVFERFFQADKSSTKSQHSSGLGLSIVKAYVELMEGKIWVESIEDKGSTFHFTIPYNKVEKGSTGHEKDVIGAMDKTNSLTNKTILVVEDDESSAEYLEIVIKSFGINNLVWAENGQESINLCKENPAIDLVLMDIDMPVMNGYKATKAIRAIRPDLPIIAQTAYALSGDQEKSIEAGCDDYISKPVKKEELLEKLEKLLK